MKLFINGKEKTLEARLDLEELLHAEGYGNKLVAVALNGTFVPKEQRGHIVLAEGDTLEILAPMQGG